MAKPPPERLHPSTYPWSFDIPPRFGDIDPLKHLNNVALAGFYEDGRVRFVDDVGARAALEPGCRFVVAEVAIQYLAEGRYPQVVTAKAGLLRLGRSSLVIGQALFQEDACIGTSETTLVYVHAREGGARPLPGGVREALHRYSLSEPSPMAPAVPGHAEPDPETSKESFHA